MLLIFKPPFPNESYRKGVCRALWARTPSYVSPLDKVSVYHKISNIWEPPLNKFNHKVIKSYLQANDIVVGNNVICFEAIRNSEVVFCPRYAQ